MIRPNIPDEFMLNEYYSEEAWMGIDNPFKLDMIKHMGILRTTYNSLTRAIDHTDRDKLGQTLNDNCDDFGKMVAKHTNSAGCTFGLMEQMNAAAYPMCWDATIVPRKTGENVILELEDIVETKNGYKFRNKKDKHLLLMFGFEFFEKKEFTDGELAAIMMHEIGHCFQHMLQGINQNIMDYMLHQTYEMVAVCLNLLVIGTTFGMSIIFALIGVFTINSDSKIDKRHNRSYTRDMLKDFGDEVDRKKIGEALDTQTEEYIDYLIYKKPKKDASKGLKLLKLFFGIFTGIMKFVLGTALSPIMLFSIIPQALFVSNSKHFEKNKKFEQFADAFATAYGLGPELNSALGKMGAQGDIDLDTMNFLNYIPGATLPLHYMNYALTSLGSKTAGYSSISGRMGDNYKSLLHELEVNDKLTNKEKADIKANIDRMKYDYETYTHPKGSKHLIPSLLIRMSTSLEKDKNKSSVVDNVHSVMEDRKLQTEIKRYEKENKPLKEKAAFAKATVIFGKSIKFFAKRGLKFK